MGAGWTIAGRTASAIAQSVEDGVRGGHLPPGQRLPALRTLAAQLQVSPGTVAAAWRTLRNRGLVTGTGRGGTHVAGRPPVAAPAPPPLPAGLRDLASGNPDARLLPLFRLARRSELPSRSRLYGEPRVHPELARMARVTLEGDGIPHRCVSVVGGALEGIERLLQAHLRPGDRVGLEDPGYTGVRDLLGALGLPALPLEVDEEGPRPEAVTQALRGGARALVVTPRAQNPFGAALSVDRGRELTRILARHPDVLLIEDDHAGPVSGAPAVTLVAKRRRWAHVRSVSKSLGPDLRLSVLAGDEATLARVEGRHELGAGWVSTILQTLVASLWKDEAVARLLVRAEAAYTRRRKALLDALAAEGIRAYGQSGLNVWIPVRDESAAVASLAASGWAVRPGERYRQRCGPAIRVTTASLDPDEATHLARDLAGATGGARSARLP